MALEPTPNLASKGGAPTNPDWFHNLMANPKATIETGTETFPVGALVAVGEERERTKSKRQIPVVVLESR